MTETKEKRKKRRLTWVMLSAVLLGLWVLCFSSFMADDFITLGMLEGVSPLPGRSPFFLYTLADGNPATVQKAKNAGAWPWFFQPRFKMNFFRPLSSLLLTLDHRLFGLHPLGYTLHTLLWYLLLVIGVAGLYKKTLDQKACLWALLVFSISGILTVNLLWASSRHLLIAAALGVWALLAFFHWRQTGRPLYRLLSLFGYLLALLAGEAGLATMAYPLATALTGPAGEKRIKLRSLLPWISLAGVYLATYQLLGFGAANGSGYVNPLVQPVAYLIKLPARLLGLLGGLLLGGITDMVSMDPAGKVVLALAGVASLMIFCRPWQTLRSEKRSSISWFATAGLVSCLPLAATDVAGFRLTVPFLGAAAVIGGFLTPAGKRIKSAPWLLLALFHLLLAPLQRLGSPPLLKQFMNTRLEAAMNELDHDFPRLADKRVIILNAPDLALGFHPYFYRRLFRRSMPRSWQILSWGAGEQRIERIDARTFSVVFVGRGLPARTFVPGDRVALPGMEITVRDVDHSAIRFFQCRLERSADDGEWLFLHWKENRFQRMNMPPSGHSANLRCDPPTLRP